MTSVAMSEMASVGDYYKGSMESMQWSFVSQGLVPFENIVFDLLL